MSFRVSDRGRERASAREAERQRKLAARRWDGAKLEPLNTAEGLLARGGALQARCSTGECSRRVKVDLHHWVRHGFGAVGLRLVEQAYRCARLDCGLRFDTVTYPAGVPLQHFVGGPERIVIRCRQCGAGRKYEAAALIAALERAGTGDVNAGVADLGRLVRGRCKACGCPGWIAELRRPPALGQAEGKG